MHHHDHHGTAPADLSAADLTRRRRSIGVLCALIIPLVAAAIIGMALLWPAARSQGPAAMGQERATITAVSEKSCRGVVGMPTTASGGGCAALTVHVDSGPDKGKVVENLMINQMQARAGARVGVEVQVSRVQSSAGPVYQFVDYSRGTPLALIAVLFAVVVIAVARWRGARALIGLGFTGAVLWWFTFPALLEGSTPVLVGAVSAAVIMVVVLFAVHGVTVRTATAFLGTMAGVLLCALMAMWLFPAAHLTGISDEGDFLLVTQAPQLDLAKALLCGIVIAGLGVLNDVTITQASAVWELAESGCPPKELFPRALRIGQDHIASSVYTLAFASAGASLAMLLLVRQSPLPLGYIVESSALGTELIRSLIALTALVLTVPLTTLIAVILVRTTAPLQQQAEGRGD